MSSMFDSGGSRPVADGDGWYEQALERLRMAAECYYNGDGILMTDDDYDRLFREVVDFETVHGLSSTVTSNVAAGMVEPGADVRHEVPMLSLDNAMAGSDELDGWFGRVAPAGGFAVEPKLDGLAMSLTYTNGVLTGAATRGDGFVGEDMLANMVGVRGVPSRLGADVTVIVRGEVVLTEADLAVANELRVAHGDRPFANARNGAAGALRGAASRGYRIPLSFGAYAVVGGGFTSHVEAMCALDGWGVTTARALCGFEHQLFDSAGAVSAEIDRIERLRSDGLPVAIDGAVVKVDGKDRCVELGATSKAPRWAVAYKYAPQEVSTVLRDIVLQVGRTGVITPVAVLDPVQVGGVMVERTTLSNPGQVAAKRLRVGATVVVRRAGDVIPEVTGVLVDDEFDKLPEWVPPSECPNCGDEVDRSSLRWRCVSRGACSDIGRLMMFVSRKAYDIEGLSSKRLQLLFDAGLVVDGADLFALTVDQLAALDGLGERSARTLVAEIGEAKQQPLDRLLVALSIEVLGSTLSRRITARCGSLDEVLALSPEDLAGFDGIGPDRAMTIWQGLQDRSALIGKLRAAGVRLTADVVSVVSSDSVLAGRKVCVSGSVPGMSRDEAYVAVERLGGIPVGSVSKSTGVLVAGEGAGSKLVKAEQLGVEVLDAAEFARLAGVA